MAPDSAAETISELSAGWRVKVAVLNLVVQPVAIAVATNAWRRNTPWVRLWSERYPGYPSAYACGCFLLLVFSVVIGPFVLRPRFQRWREVRMRALLVPPGDTEVRQIGPAAIGGSTNEGALVLTASELIFYRYRRSQRRYWEQVRTPLAEIVSMKFQKGLLRRRLILRLTHDRTLIFYASQAGRWLGAIQKVRD